MSQLKDQQTYKLRLNNSNFTIANSKKIVAIVELDLDNKIDMNQEVSISISNNSVEQAFLPSNSIKVKENTLNSTSKHVVSSIKKINAVVKTNNFTNKVEDVRTIYIDNTYNFDAGEF